MTKLEELINELCPDGVEYVPIKEITKFEQPTKYIVKSTNYRDDFNTPVLTAGQTFILGYTNETDGIYNASKEHPVIIFDDFTGAFKWVDFPFKVKSSAMKMISANKDVTTLRYIYHVMGHLNFISSEHKRLWIGIYSAFRVPLPPLSIQSEIVHILDSFTLLTAELTAELTARQKQYAFYRDYLLDFSNEDVTKKIPDIDCSNVEYKKLGDISNIIRGGNFQKKDFIEQGKPCIHYGQIYTRLGTTTSKSITYLNDDVYSKSKKAMPNDIIMAVTSENIEDVCKCTVWVGNKDVAVSGHTAIIHPSINSKYLGYYFQTKMFFKQKKKLAHGTKVIEVTPDKLNDILIPVPPLSVQKNIVKILDRFDKLNNDMSEGLPAEIETRKKQYEYYRDTLLSFDDKACSHFVKVERERELTRSKAIKWLSIQDLFNLRNGYTPSKSKSEYWTNGTIPWFRMEDIRENGHILNDSIQHITPIAVKGKLFPANSIILATSASIGEHALITVDSLANQRFTYLTVKNEYSNQLNMKYIYYYFFKIDEWCKNNLNVSSFASVDMDKFKKLKFPIPPLEEQERIVSILDRFDKLCNDISEGLPAEIEARQKQYEYYRDKLLSFKEKNHA